ncbi:MAG: methyltransferase domain-containing protein [Ktedonobacteraceae bacterium]
MESNDGEKLHKISVNRWLQVQADARAYDAGYERRAQAGENVHGEVDFIGSLLPHTSFSLLDAGCGTGRIAIEAAHRGAHVVGVDLDPVMLARAREKAPHLDWRLLDLATLSLEQSFDLIVLAGNVMVFLTPDSEATVLLRLVTALASPGLLVAGFATDRQHYTLAHYDETLSALGLVLQERWATWDRKPWTPEASFTVSVHQSRV